MHILGLGGSNHDFAACIIDSEQNLLAIEDERLIRVRHALDTPNPCVPSIQYCLDTLNLHLSDIDSVVGNDMLTNLPSHIVTRAKLINHHQAHAYSSFFTSEFETAALLIVDGGGSVVSSRKNSHERETTTYALGKTNTISVISQVIGSKSGSGSTNRKDCLMSNSIGELYRAFTESIGFGFLQAGKTMALAAYGDDRFVDELSKYIKLLPEGQFIIEMEGNRGLLSHIRKIQENDKTSKNRFEINASLAFACQFFTEYILNHGLDYLHSVTQSDNLCLVGGVALNAVYNGKIPSLTNFKNIHIFFAPDDSGTAIGSAIWEYLNKKTKDKNNKIRFKLKPYLGKLYSEKEIIDAIKKYNLDFTSPLNIHEKVAHFLEQGMIVAWFQGRSEFGPRALGNRSILGDPRFLKSKTLLNEIIKNREWFRPLAPAVIETKVSQYFNLTNQSFWMQFVCPIDQHFINNLPAITHVDGGARIQSVREQDNPSFYRLLAEFEQLTGFPILLNTSFNIQGKPIVENPEQAIQVFLESAIDVLVLENLLVVKHIHHF